MKKIQAFVNGQLVDYVSATDFPIALNRDVSEAKDITKRGGDKTFNFRLPATANNRRIFGSLYLPSGVNLFYKAAPLRFDLKAGGEDVIINGSLTIKGASKEEIECFVVSSNINWANELKGKRLRELQSMKPFVLTDGSEITACNAAVDTSDPNVYDHSDTYDVVFPLAAYGQFFIPNLWESKKWISQKQYADGTYILPDGKEIFGLNEYVIGSGIGNAFLSYLDFPPAVYVRSIMRAIFKDLGYRLISPFFDFVEMRKLAILYTGERPPQWNYGTKANVELTSDGSSISEFAENTFYAEQVFTPAVLSAVFGNLSTGDGNGLILPRIEVENWGAYQTGTSLSTVKKYIAPTGGTYKIETAFDGNNVIDISVPVYDRYVIGVKMPAGSADLDLFNTITSIDFPLIYDFSAPPVLEFDPERVTVLGTISPANGAFSFSGSGEITLQAGEQLHVMFVLTSGPVPGVPPPFFKWIDGLTNLNIKINLKDGDVDLQPAAQLPNLTQLEFIQRLTSTFNLFFEVNDRDKTSYVDTRNDFYSLPIAAVDIDPYLKQLNGKTSPNQQAKIYQFAHIEDSEDYLTDVRGGYLRYSHTETNPVRDASGEQKVTAAFAQTEYDTFTIVDDTANDFVNPTWEVKAQLTIPFLTNQENYFEVQNDLVQDDSDYGFQVRFVKIKSLETLPTGAFLPYRTITAGVSTINPVNQYVRTVFDDTSTPPTPAPVFWSLSFEKYKLGLYRLFAAQLLELQKGHSLEIPVYMTAPLYRELTLRKLVSVGGGLYRLSKIKAYRPDTDGVTTIELTRIA